MHREHDARKTLCPCFGDLSLLHLSTAINLKLALLIPPAPLCPGLAPGGPIARAAANSPSPRTTGGSPPSLPRVDMSKCLPQKGAGPDLSGQAGPFDWTRR